jgi:endonuclease I
LKTAHFLFILANCACSIVVYSQIPTGYYNSAENQSEQSLKSALHNIINDHVEYDYTSSSETDTWDILKEADAQPNNPNNVLLIYTRESVNGSQEYASGAGWNREHVWAKSRGDFGTAIGAGTDVHNLRASNINVNSTRLNYSFDDCTSNSCKNTFGNYYSSSALIFEPRDEDKGDVARIIFYMDVRYEGGDDELDLEMIEDVLSTSSKQPRHGVRSTLLEWHAQDPVDDFERNRNNVIYGYQENRNPFIDHPELVDYLWGDKQDQQWNSSLSIPSNRQVNIHIPNPIVTDYLNFESDINFNRIKLFNIDGKVIHEHLGNSNRIQMPASTGIYFLQLHHGNSVILKKLIIKEF